MPSRTRERITRLKVPIAAGLLAAVLLALDSLGLAQFGLIGAVGALFGMVFLSRSSSQRALRKAADEDPLTGIGNRRKLTRVLEARIASVSDENPLRLAIFDLNGFKEYNDTFGHPAGDALLVRLARALEAALSGIGDAYRVGGDEFCVLAGDADHDALADRAKEALTERGEAFSISASCGWVELPGDTSDSEEAMRLADQRMYANKGGGRISAGSQSTDVLVQVLAERHPDIGVHVDTVTELSTRVAAQLGLPEEERTAIRQAASLHDIGKVAIPDSVLNKPGALDEEEWAFIRQHTLIGESILEVAPALKATSKLVRSSHESFDGAGYPDQLAGEDIPLGSRVIAVCDAFDAMVSERPYAGSQSSAKALAEIRRCSGTQFDPRVVEAFALVLAAKSNGHKPSPQSYRVKAASTT
jgi:two-component system cell cycle response regulator